MPEFAQHLHLRDSVRFHSDGFDVKPHLGLPPPRSPPFLAQCQKHPRHRGRWPSCHAQGPKCNRSASPGLDGYFRAILELSLSRISKALCPTCLLSPHKLPLLVDRAVRPRTQAPRVVPIAPVSGQLEDQKCSAPAPDKNPQCINASWRRRGRQFSIGVLERYLLGCECPKHCRTVFGNQSTKHSKVVSAGRKRHGQHLHDVPSRHP